MTNPPDDMSPSQDHTPTGAVTGGAGVATGLEGGWRSMKSAPRDGTRVLVDFRGAGPVVAFCEAANPDLWIRYLGYGKSRYWPTVHADYALGWMPLPASPALDADAPSSPGPNQKTADPALKEPS